MGTVSINIARNQGLLQSLRNYAKSQDIDASRINVGQTIQKLKELQARRKANNEQSIYRGGDDKMIVSIGAKEFSEQEMDELFEAMGLKVKRGFNIPEQKKEQQVGLKPVQTPFVPQEIKLPGIKGLNEAEETEEEATTELITEETETKTTTIVEETVEEYTFDDPAMFQQAVDELKEQGYEVEQDENGNVSVRGTEEVVEEEQAEQAVEQAADSGVKAKETTYPDRLPEAPQSQAAPTASEEVQEVVLDSSEVTPVEVAPVSEEQATEVTAEEATEEVEEEVAETPVASQEAPAQETQVEVFPVKVDETTGEVVRDTEKEAELAAQQAQAQEAAANNKAQAFKNWAEKVRTDENFNEDFVYTEADTTEGQDQDLASLATDFIALYDTDGDGQIQYEEFRDRYVQDKKQEIGPKAFGEMVAKFSSAPSPEDRAELEFKKEAYNVFSNMHVDTKTGKALTREEVMATLFTIDATNKDVDANGRISRPEFLGFTQSIHKNSTRERIQQNYNDYFKPAVNQ